VRQSIAEAVTLGQDGPATATMGRFRHNRPMAGMATDRRLALRRHVGRRIRDLRRGEGWTQEKLAEKLEIDRRQLFRLEQAQAAVTLEVLEAVAGAFRVPLFSLIYSVVESDVQDDIRLPSGAQIAREEYAKVFGTAMARPDVALIAQTVGLLSDDDLSLLAQLAEKVWRAKLVDDDVLEDFLTDATSAPPPVLPTTAGAIGLLAE
jgi:transcriptional regulator with XRE-family HTH domain